MWIEFNIGGLGTILWGSPGFILAQKLRALKANLKKWNREESGDLALRKENLLIELMGLDAREELLGLSDEDQFRHIQLKGDIEQLASLGKFPGDKNLGLCM